MDLKQRIAKLIKTYRDLNGWTQEDLAKKLGKKQQHILEYEKGKYLPGTKNLMSFVKVLKIPPNRVFDEGHTVDLLTKFEKKFSKYSHLADTLDKNPEIVAFILYYAENKSKFKNIELTEVLNELAKIPQNKRKNIVKALSKLVTALEE